MCVGFVHVNEVLSLSRSVAGVPRASVNTALPDRPNCGCYYYALHTLQHTQKISIYENHCLYLMYIYIHKCFFWGVWSSSMQFLVLTKSSVSVLFQF